MSGVTGCGSCSEGLWPLTPGAVHGVSVSGCAGGVPLCRVGRALAPCCCASVVGGFWRPRTQEVLLQHMGNPHLAALHLHGRSPPDLCSSTCYFQLIMGIQQDSWRSNPPGSSSAPSLRVREQITLGFILPVLNCCSLGLLPPVRIRNGGLGFDLISSLFIHLFIKNPHFSPGSQASGWGGGAAPASSQHRLRCVHVAHRQ